MIATETPPVALDCDGYRKLVAEVELSEKRDKAHNYRAKLAWVLARAKNWAEKIGCTTEEMLDEWEKDRDYWFMSYYQDANQPELTENFGRIFETQADLLAALGKPQFRCPACAGVSTSPYECNSGKPMAGQGKKGTKSKPCDWKVYGLLRDLGKGITIYVKEKRRCERIFMPIAWEPKPEIGQLVTIEQIEIRHIQEVIDKTDTLDKAAAILGIDITTLFRKRKRYKMPMRNTTGEKKP
jgi:hypothetical protein